MNNIDDFRNKTTMIEKKRVPLISVIVPLYNVELYARRCIESIINQTYSKLQIILVDDGSTDNTGKICDLFSFEDLRVQVIHKANGGLSDARNCGLREAKGDFVVFVDGDDYISVNHIYHLYNAANMTGADIATCWFKKSYYIGIDSKSYRIEREHIVGVYSPYDCLEKMLYQNGIETCAWGKLYKSSLFDGIEYPVDKLYEDIPVTYKLILKSNYIVVLKNRDYYYYQRQDSIQNRSFSPQKMDAIYNMYEMKEEILNQHASLNKAVQCRMFCVACNILFQIPKGPCYKKEKELLWNIIKKNRINVILNIKARRKARVGAICSLFGLKIMRIFFAISKSNT